MLEAAVELGAAGAPLLDRRCGLAAFPTLHAAYRRNPSAGRPAAAGRGRRPVDGGGPSAARAAAAGVGTSAAGGGAAWPGAAAGAVAVTFPAARVAIRVTGWARSRLARRRWRARHAGRRGRVPRVGDRVLCVCRWAACRMAGCRRPGAEVPGGRRCRVRGGHPGRRAAGRVAVTGWAPAGWREPAGMWPGWRSRRAGRIGSRRVGRRHSRRRPCPVIDASVRPGTDRACAGCAAGACRRSVQLTQTPRSPGCPSDSDGPPRPRTVPAGRSRPDSSDVHHVHAPARPRSAAGRPGSRRGPADRGGARPAASRRTDRRASARPGRGSAVAASAPVSRGIGSEDARGLHRAPQRLPRQPELLDLAHAGAPPPGSCGTASAWSGSTSSSPWPSRGEAKLTPWRWATARGGLP